MVYDNELVRGWLRDLENDGNIGDAMIFRHHVFLYGSRQLILLLWIFLDVWVFPCPAFISKGARVPRKVHRSVAIIILVRLYL
jgi:hypothetical protein